jgi:hypothetical protein
MPDGTVMSLRQRAAAAAAHESLQDVDTIAVDEAAAAFVMALGQPPTKVGGIAGGGIWMRADDLLFEHQADTGLFLVRDCEICDERHRYRLKSIVDLGQALADRCPHLLSQGRVDRIDQSA